MAADVAIRLGMKGGTEVERAFKSVGREGKVALREIQEAARGLPPHMVAISRAVGGAKDEIAAFASRAPGNLGAVASSFGFLGTAVAGATVLVAAFAVKMIQGAVAAAAYGDEMEATARKIGVGVEELQRLQFAAGETDVPIEALNGGLENLNANLGAFKSGVGDVKVKEAFEFLGLTPEALAGVQDAAQFLPILADRLAAVRDQAERVKLAKMLGVQDLLPLLEKGAAGIEQLAAAADEAGVVIDEGMITKLADLDRQMEITDQRLKATSTTFFGQFSPAVAEGKDKLASLLVIGSDVITKLDDITASLEKSDTAWANATLGVKNHLDMLGKFFFLGGLAFVPGKKGGGFELSDPAAYQALNSGERGYIPKGPAPDKKKPKGGSRRKGEDPEKAAAREAKEAKARTETLRDLELQNRLTIARAAGLKDQIQFLEDQAALLQLISQYERGGLDSDRARLAAQIQIAALQRMRAEVLRFDGNPDGFVSTADRMADLKDISFEPDWDELREGFRASFKDGVREAMDEGLLEGLSSIVEDAFITGMNDSLDNIADMLFDVFKEIWTQLQASKAAGGGSSGIDWTAVASMFLGGGGGGGGSTGFSSGHLAGGRAGGGPVYRGDIRPFQEYGYEKVRFAADAYVTDAATTARQMIDARPMAAPSSARPAGGGGPTAVTVINPPGVPLQARVTERPDGAGGSRLDIQLLEMVDGRVDGRVKAMTRGGRDDIDLQRNFGMCRQLRGP